MLEAWHSHLFLKPHMLDTFFSPARVLLLFMLLISVMTAVAAPKTNVLRLGIVPFNAPVSLFRTHQPLQSYLETALNRPVMLLTSPSHAQFLRDSLDGRFDIVITPAHFGAVCLHHDFAPLLRYRGEMNIVFAVRSEPEDEFASISALQGKKIAFPDRTGILNIVGTKILEEMGMRREVDYRGVDYPSNAAAMIAVSLGKADAAVATYPLLEQMQPEVRAKLKAIPWGKSLPHLMILAMKRLGEDEIRQLKRAFERFPDTPGGRQFFRETRYMGYAEITPEDLETIQPYVKQTMDVMEEIERAEKAP